MSFSVIVGRFATGTYTVTRTAAGSYTLGRYTAGSASTLTITASMQPIRGSELQLLPEAQHAEEVRALFASAELFTRTPTHEPDQVTIDGETWEVIRCERWQGFDSDEYWKAYVARKATP